MLGLDLLKSFEQTIELEVTDFRGGLDVIQTVVPLDLRPKRLDLTDDILGPIRLTPWQGAGRVATSGASLISTSRHQRPRSGDRSRPAEDPLTPGQLVLGDLPGREPKGDFALR